METQYFKDYSFTLGRDMEMKVYGHGGRPVLFFPCQDGRFFDFENFKMTDAWSPWLESGQVMVFSIDTVDKETWSDKWSDPYWRIRRYEQWIAYITDEVVPFMRAMVNQRNGWTGEPGVMVFGCSLGATHALNLFLRRPDRKKGVVCVGQGPWEIPETTRQMAHIFHEKDIHLWVDFWGWDVSHDWEWWYKQVAYFVPYLLDQEG